MALKGGEGSVSHPGRSLPPGRTLYPMYRRLGGPQGRSGQVRKISPPLGLNSRTVQPIGSRYTDCGIPAHTPNCGVYEMFYLSDHVCSRINCPPIYPWYLDLKKKCVDRTRSLNTRNNHFLPLPSQFIPYSHPITWHYIAHMNEAAALHKI
jgi:hypothetical protein